MKLYKVGQDGNIYPKSVYPSDWKSTFGYDPIVSSSSEQEQNDIKVLIIQPQAASHGVTLTAANTVVFWSPVMSVETYLQCIARIDRVGQVNSMTVVHLQGSEVERKVYQMLQGKVDSHEKLVDLYKQEIGI
jgi:hypothetical protein